MSLPKITLYFREGSSDKVYQASIENSGGAFHVCFAYGRRGSTLTAGRKTTVPVSLPAAEKVYEKLVREKKTKGYTEGADGVPVKPAPAEAPWRAEIGAMRPCCSMRSPRRARSASSGMMRGACRRSTTAAGS